MSKNKKQRKDAANKPTCRNCRFFLLENAAQGTGLCRRYPAVPVNTMNAGIQAFFPSMLAYGWCGEYQPVAGKVPAAEPKPAHQPNTKGTDHDSQEKTPSH